MLTINSVNSRSILSNIVSLFLTLPVCGFIIVTNRDQHFNIFLDQMKKYLKQKKTEKMVLIHNNSYYRIMYGLRVKLRVLYNTKTTIIGLKCEFL